ncbi:peptidase inhibitor 16-like [Haliotis rufescens]|uniref:peptidase inhibitor 16-like n=1 Tax=Haliotis rufescens TaxID=6454 RepID=UPI00201F3BF6|nr:peptidase inhibitor 16-like [Haliotis rufescens]
MQNLCVLLSFLLPLAVSSEKIGLGSFRDQILDQHNEYRREEQASNMCLMKWNDTLAAAAERWADRCVFKHEMKSGMGENLAFDTRKFDTPKLLDGLMKGWHDEKRTWKYGSQSCGYACHFTQLVWHSTNAVGCAATRCGHLGGLIGAKVKHAFYLVCFYYPRGNWMGEVPYIPGRACSKCEKGAACSEELCEGGGGPEVAAAPAPAPAALTLREPLPRSRGHVSFVRKSSRFETFSHGTGANRKSVSRGTSTLHRSGPISLDRFRRPLALKANSLLSDQGTSLVSKQPRQLAYSSARELNYKVAKKNKPKRHRSRCRDRLPACWKWADRCKGNRAIRIMCPKSCESCEMVLALVDGRLDNRSQGSQSTVMKKQVRSGSIGQRRGVSRATRNRHQSSARQRHQSEKATINRHQSAARKTDSTRQNGGQISRRQSYSSRRQARYHHSQQSSRESRYGQRHNTGRHHHQSRQHNRGASRATQHRTVHQTRSQDLKNKHTVSAQHRKQQNAVLPQKDTPFCTDNANYAARCVYWAKTGFCQENYMMRDLYCKKSCGNC